MGQSAQPQEQEEPFLRSLTILITMNTTAARRIADIRIVARFSFIHSNIVYTSGTRTRHFTRIFFVSLVASRYFLMNSI